MTDAQFLVRAFGYDEHDPEGHNGPNSRNGIRSKTVMTEIGPVEIDEPGDRDGTFEPKLVKGGSAGWARSMRW